MKSRIGWLLMTAGLALTGCGDLPETGSILPAGIEETRVPPPTAGSGAEALGETRGHDHAAHTLSTEISEPTPIGEYKKAASGLTYTTLKAGDGPEVKPGQTIKVDYVGRLEDGTEFDSSIKKKQPLTCVIGAGQVIKGWDAGIPGMRVGEKRRIVIPSDLAYGTKGYPPTIPANANLNFVIDLLEAK